MFDTIYYYHLLFVTMKTTIDPSHYFTG